MNKAKVISNLECALGVIKAFPPQNIDLGDFIKEKNDCGTCYCSLGLLANSEEFPYIRFQKYGSLRTVVVVPNTQPHSSQFVNVFGPNAFDVLFEPYGMGLWDKEITNTAQPVIQESCGLTDYQLAVARFEFQIEVVKGMES